MQQQINYTAKIRIKAENLSSHKIYIFLIEMLRLLEK